MKSALKQLLSRILLLGLLGSVLLPVGAASRSDQTVRVGVYPMRGYHELASDGTADGYEIAYLNLIARETGWHYRYIPLQNWQQGLEMLQKGQLDLLSPAESTTDRTRQFLFSSYPIGRTCTALATRQSNDIMYEDFSKFSHMTIGVEAGTAHVQELQEYAAVSGFQAHMKFYDSFIALKQALQNGQVDAIAPSILRMDKDLKLIGRFHYTDYYFMMPKRATQLRNRLNQAIDAISSSNPTIQSQLEHRYFPNAFNEPITRQESNLISSSGPITVGIRSDATPFSYRKAPGGQLEGIDLAFLKLLEKHSGLTFRCIVLPYTANWYNTLRQSHVNLVLDVRNCDASHTIENLSLSDTYLTMHDALIAKSGFSYLAGREYAIAVPPDMPLALFRSAFTAYPYLLPQRYPTYEACLSAVQSGAADAALLNQYTADLLLRRWRYDDLIVVPGIGVEDNLSIGVLGDPSLERNQLLLSILNKSIRDIPDTALTAAVMGYMTADPYPITPLDLWSRWRYEIIMLGLCTLSLTAVTLLFFAWRARYVRQLRQSNQKLQTASAAKSEFLSRISHDIRTPMNAIIGMTHIAQDEHPVPAVADCLHKIDMASHFMLGLVNDILDVTKMECDKMELHPECYTLQEFAETISTMIQPVAQQKQLQFTVRLPSEPLAPLWVDKLRLNQIFFNLLSNSIKFTKTKGAVSLTVETASQEVLPSAEPNRQVLRFIVADTGIGIRPQFIPHMFDAFSRESAAAATDAPGSGLGLSIVKSLIELMHGTIEVASTLGVGTVFTVLLPFPPRPSHAEQPLPAGADVLRGRHILLAEDNAINTQIARMLLEKKQIQVDHASNGSEAVSAFSISAPHTYDAILMDLRMPVMDGREAARRIRQTARPDARTVPIIAMTADTVSAAVVRDQIEEIDAHLSKPIDPDALYQMLIRMMPARGKD